MPFWPEPESKEDMERLASIADRRVEWEKKAREVEDDNLLQIEAARRGTKRDRVLPIDAERWAAEKNLPPFVRPAEDPGAVFECDEHRTDIPLSLAVMWVAWRDRAQAGWAWERYCVWGRRLWAEPEVDGQEVSLAEAERELKAALRTGAITALGRRPPDCPLKPIGVDYWPNAAVFYDGLGGMVGPSEDVWDFGEVIVPKTAVFETWKPVASRGKPGRKNRQDAYRDEAIRMRAAGFEGGLLHPLLRWGEENLPVEERLQKNSLQSRISEWKL